MKNPPPFTAFSRDEQERIQRELNNKLDKEDISYRPSAAGNVAYVEGWRTFNLANQVFGFNGWSSEIVDLSVDFCETDQQGKVSVGMSCMVRVYLRDGTFHDDIGYGSSEGGRSKAGAFEKARKEAVTDAMKRALRVFGNRLGNCAYDKVFLKQVKSAGYTTAVQPNPPPVLGVKQNQPVAVNPVNQQFKNENSTLNQPPEGYKPVWQPARTALPSTAVPHNQNMNMNVNLNHHNPNQQQNAHSVTDTLHSDDFEALITEADLYDLEVMQMG